MITMPWLSLGRPAGDIPLGTDTEDGTGGQVLGQKTPRYRARGQMRSPDGDEEQMSERFRTVAERLQRERNGSLGERVYRSLRGAILAGRLEPGERITEFELAAALKVSRTPLREALQRLESEGLVLSEPGRGTVVRGLTPTDLAEIYQIRRNLEGLAARLAAARITPAELEKLRSHLELMEFFTQRERWEDVIEQNIAFHSTVYSASGNRRLADLLYSLQEYVQGTRGYALRVPGRAPHALAEHRALYEALAAGDADRAAEIASAHVLNTSQQVLSAEAEVHNRRPSPAVESRRQSPR